MAHPFSLTVNIVICKVKAVIETIVSKYRKFIKENHPESIILFHYTSLKAFATTKKDKEITEKGGLKKNKA